jgi:hypothetical protein
MRGGSPRRALPPQYFSEILLCPAEISTNGPFRKEEREI